MFVSQKEEKVKSELTEKRERKGFVSTDRATAMNTTDYRELMFCQKQMLQAEN